MIKNALNAESDVKYCFDKPDVVKLLAYSRLLMIDLSTDHENVM